PGRVESRGARRSFNDGTLLFLDQRKKPVIIFIRGLIFLTTLTLLGIYGLECFVLGLAIPETHLVSRRWKRWARGCLWGLLAATAADLLQRTFNLTGSWPLAVHAIYPMLFVTHVGHVWIVRGL